MTAPLWTVAMLMAVSTAFLSVGEWRQNHRLRAALGAGFVVVFTGLAVVNFP